MGGEWSAFEMLHWNWNRPKRTLKMGASPMRMHSLTLILDRT
jgi:hypothetical protein